MIRMRRLKDNSILRFNPISLEAGIARRSRGDCIADRKREMAGDARL